MRLSRSPLRIGAVLVSALSFRVANVPGDEFPQDTNTIGSLTTAQAEKLVERFCGSGIRFGLDGLTTLDPETAQALANGAPRDVGNSAAAHTLSLGGLVALDAATAEALAGSRWDALNLDGLTTLPVSTARALAPFKGILTLGGLRALDADAAGALAEFKGPISP